ncbi:hypothetical protein KAR91_14410 [Candidatus Pacearchaeota archaeon]|nr:hypothetical protein [Candidatus Pacearchaeota archaeon]
MPYVVRDKNLNIISMSTMKNIIEKNVKVSDIRIDQNIVTLVLEEDITSKASEIKKIKVFGSSRCEYNGSFVVEKKSNNEFTYKLGVVPKEKPSGDIRAIFYFEDNECEFLDHDHKDIKSIKKKFDDVDKLKSHHKELSSTDYKIIRHYEEICGEVANNDKSLSKDEFCELRANRNKLRKEIKSLTSKLKKRGLK